MTISRYPATKSSVAIHDILHDMYDGEPLVAVEVFGPPEAMRHDPHEDTDCGPWLLGPRDEVYAYAQASGYEWETQYEISHEEE
jgi:hypothetical protein